MKKNLLLALISLLILFLGVNSLKQTSPNFEQYTAGEARKTAFFHYFLPLINAKNTEISLTRKKLQLWNKSRNNLGWWDARQINALAIQYRVKEFDIVDDISWDKLLIKVDVIPPALVLAQAANESAWGTSRFAKLGNNYFGQWCYTKGCGLVPNKRAIGKVHEVAAFKSPAESLESYMQNLNSHPAYKSLRQIRTQLYLQKLDITGTALAAGLMNYSERGEEYIKELRAMIKFNNLSKYDESIHK